MASMGSARLFDFWHACEGFAFDLPFPDFRFGSDFVLLVLSTDSFGRRVGGFW